MTRMTEVRYFGNAWPSQAAEGSAVSTPIGESCGGCHEAISDGDRGVFIPLLEDGSVVDEPWHRECAARSIWGGIEHLTAPEGHPVGSCYNGSKLTYRRSAVLAWMHMAKQRVVL